MASWVLTKQLQAFRDQMNAAFPDRDRTSDGTISDAAHQAESRTGHSPDDTPGSNPEWDGDPDNTPEVRAIDIDSDTGDPEVSMEDIVQHLLRLARAGKLTMIRYMIFNRRIWSASTDWAQQTYTGSSPHTEHLHLSGAYTQAADEDAGADYHLEDLVSLSDPDKAWIVANVGPDAQLKHDGLIPNYGNDKDTNPYIAPWWALGRASLNNTLLYALRDSALPALSAKIDAVLAAVGQVDEQVAARLIGETPEATAAALKAVLGDQAAEVGRILAASA